MRVKHDWVLEEQIWGTLVKKKHIQEKGKKQTKPKPEPNILSNIQ